jgi:hypothetical protein
MIGGMLVSPVFGQASGPSLADTLEWLHRSSLAESLEPINGTHIDFESSGCSVEVTEYREQAGAGFWIKNRFSLADIDRMSVTIDHDSTFKDFVGVYIYTTNDRDKILHTSNSLPADGLMVNEYYFFTPSEYAPRFAKALKHAVQLCGGKPSAF